MSVVSRIVLCACLLALVRPAAATGHRLPAQGQARHASSAESQAIIDDGRQATGIVTQASCAASGPRIDLQTSSETLHLHSARTGGLAIKTMFRPPAGFNPCTSLKGMRATVEYKPDAGDGQSGTMTSLQLFLPGTKGGTKNPVANGAQTPTRSDEVSDEQDEHRATTTAQGEIVDLVCDGNEMLVTMATSKRKLALHTRNYTLLDWLDDRPVDATNVFLPCSQLKGHTASVTYVVVQHRSYGGEIHAIEIKK